MMYDSWDIEHDRQIFLSFLPFYPPNKPNYQNFEKILKTPGDIIILHMSTINYNHIMYGSWDIERDRQSFFFILDNFLPSYPLKTWKIKILKKWKKNPLEILSFYTSVPKIRIICYTVPEIWHMMDVIIFHFGLFFALLSPSSLKNEN